MFSVSFFHSTVYVGNFYTCIEIMSLCERNSCQMNPMFLYHFVSSFFFISFNAFFLFHFFLILVSLHRRFSFISDTIDGAKC